MSKASAVVRTESAKRYLGQFCKHFAHKLPVELAEGNDSGLVSFEIGTCRLSADAEALVLKLEATAPENLARLQDVTERHLVRFAFREALPIEWAQA